MMFEKHHYEVIACILAQHEGSVSKRELVWEFSTVFQTDNPAFDAQRFQSACYRKAVKCV